MSTRRAPAHRGTLPVEHQPVWPASFRPSLRSLHTSADKNERGEGEAPSSGASQEWYEQAQSQRAQDGHYQPSSLALLRRSAEAGHLGAAHEMGLLLIEGHAALDLAPDAPRALEYFLQAARGGAANAQYNVGLMYATGRATGTPDWEQATEWYAQAADQDFAPAQCNLGLLYLERYFASASRTGAPGSMRASDLLSQAVRMLLLAGEQGMPSAHFNLALLYRNVFHQPDQAVRYLTRAAEGGSPHAQYNLAEMYWTGLEVPPDEARAEQFALQAAHADLPKAQTLLGLIYWKREQVEEARLWLSRAADQNDAGGHFHLSQWLRVHDSLPAATPSFSSSSPSSPSIPSYSALAYGHLQQAAQGGHAAAQFTLGLAHQQNLLPAEALSPSPSEGEAASPPSAVEWIQRAAEQGLVEAQSYLGSLYLYGKGGVQAQREQAIHWYQQAAEQGSAEAMVQLGLLRAESHPEESRSWLLRAAEQGDAQAQVNLGLLAWQQQKDTRPSAREWFERAAQQENADAYYYLALLARSGKGGATVDGEQARLHLERAAELGHAKAAYRLGELYLTGDGLQGPTDRSKALHYFSRAADLGDSVASTVLDAMSSKASRAKKKRDRSTRHKASFPISSDTSGAQEKE